MKKQFFRVKQLADQTFSRVGKTEVLSNDLQGADKTVEFIRNACQNTSKKLAATLLGQGVDAASKEKRLKKSPDYLLGHSMLDSSVSEKECLLSCILSSCGKVETTLAEEVVEHDLRVEQEVLNPIMQILDTEVPNILKHKRNLAKLILDMDSARTRHQTALKHSANTAGGTAKVDSIKEELEDAELKVEQCRDMLATEMFTLMSKEAYLSQLVVEYVKLQRAYHENALNILENVIPDLESQIKNSPTKPVYGQPLEEHLRLTGKKIAFPIELCVCVLLELGIEEEGLFRVAGGASKVRRLKMSFDACRPLTTLDYHDPHVVAGALKSYLRELPEPLFTHSLYDDWMAAARIQGSSEERLQALWQVLHRLPTPNYENVRYLIKFLSVLSRNQEVNKMTPQNIAIVIAPNLIWSQADDACGPMGMNMSTANLHSFIVDNLVSYADWFFPEELEFYQTISRPTGEGTVSTNGSDTSVRGGVTVNGISGMSTSMTSESQHRKGLNRSSSGSGDALHISSEMGLKRTQSGSSLSDHGSPPHGSPKPVIRRKNKPAPVPPVDKPDKPPRPVAICSLTDTPPKKTSELAPLARSEEDDEDDDDGGFKGRVVPSTQALRVPVAAPRTIVPAGKDSQEESPGVDVSSSVEVERHKPAVPERPPSLRAPYHPVAPPLPVNPLSPQGGGEADAAEPSVRPMLERTYMYSVDKQQVSIIQVGGEKTTVLPSPSSSPAHNTSSEHPNNSGNARLICAAPVDKKEVGPSEKPERPPKPENLGHMSTLERRRPSNSSHSRTMSDGNVTESVAHLDPEKLVMSGKPTPCAQPAPAASAFNFHASSTASLATNSGLQLSQSSASASAVPYSSVMSPTLPPSSPRVTAHSYRPPRPTPPPPPPPTINASSQTVPVKPRASSVSESTDL